MADEAVGISAVFDAVVAQADTPMWVVTVAAGEQRAGCLVGFATQVSIEPRVFLACLSKANRTYEIAQHATHLAVHLLGTTALPLAELFGSETGSAIDKFDHCEWTEGPHLLPILTGAAGWFTGNITRTVDFGDHVGFLLSPTAAHLRKRPPTSLRYHAVAGLTPGHSAD